MKNILIFICALQITNTLANAATEKYTAKYEPKWESLDKRPLPEWYDQAKIGIFLHWGVYAVPGFGSEWFWMKWKGTKLPSHIDFMKKNYPPNFTYQDFAKDFKAEFYDPDQWAKLFKASGAKYVVLTSKHHEGYTLWPSTYSYSWNAMDVGPQRDLLGDLTEAVRNHSLRMGFYYSLYEWFNPRYLADKRLIFTRKDYIENKMMPELKELVNRYEPDIVWSDGDAEAMDSYWKGPEFLAWLYNESPVKDKVVVNDRWGLGTHCKHGGYFTCNDRYNPGVLQPHKWENAMTVDKYSWGHRRYINSKDVLTSSELIKTMVETVSCGGNILINVGPTKEGTIIPIFQEKLLDLGRWLSVNGEAIYSSTPWSVQNDSIAKVWYTAKPATVYAISLEWPSNSRLLLGSTAKLFTSPNTTVDLLVMVSGLIAGFLYLPLCYCLYTATWESLDTRPLPPWYDRAKVGIFLHWGIYSVPAFGTEWFWKNLKENKTNYVNYMKENYRPGFTYQEFAPEFTAKFFNPKDWATLFQEAGANYVVLTTKHHEGFTLWPSSYSYSWNSVDLGAHRDLVDELTTAVRAAGLRMGFYYSLLEWYNPLYMRDKANNFQSTVFSDNKVGPELQELVEKYQPDIIWSDGEWEANDTYWKSQEFLAWLYNESPVKDEVVVNDRWGQKFCASMAIFILAMIGNILLNVGPTKEGMIIPIYQERLRGLGKWLKLNGEAIYNSVPWKVQNDTLHKTWYTARDKAVYALCLNWPRAKTYELGSVADLFVSNSTTVELLGYGEVDWNIYYNLVEVTFPDRSEVLGDWVWVLKITNYPEGA
ncbi:alpha-l-fucosidase [Holotrichia oblita]|uniref:Alpha-l-fucosidase n=1 Tax=Holotrichia oblita TaxID=644536 RepID=A0ACB9TRR0_HOLOL|nr:alpha-l-fucosidase [Holotrichia oblita]